MADAEALLRRFLRLWRPRSVLALGDGVPAALEDYAAGGQGGLHAAGPVAGHAALAGLGRFDLAVVCEQLEAIDKRAGVELLGRLKNLHSPRICVLIDLTRGQGRAWRPNDFLGLGFHDPREQQAAQACRLFYYDIGTYNPERRWNNPSHWANPENFQRFRW